MEKIIIYIAGNPDAYPMEYYDEETESFQGVIPELMRTFSEQSVYDVRYYSPGKQDQREQLAQNLQVDVISGCRSGEAFRHAENGEIVLLHSVEEGEPNVYQLLLTDAAPGAFKTDLQNFLSEMDGETVTGLVIGTARKNPPVNRDVLRASFGGLLLLILLLFLLLCLLIRKYRRRLQTMTEEREADDLTGIGNREYLERYYRSYLNDKNKVLYSLFYFHIDTDQIDRVYGREKTNDFLRNTAVILQDYTSDTDILAKISDNGFVMLRLSMNPEEDREWFEPALRRIRTFAAGGMQDDSQKVAVGIYRLKLEDHDLDAMIFQTEQGAQAAYRDGKDFLVCTDEVLARFAQERRLQADVKRGLENQEFKLYMQYYVDLKSGAVVGGESLSRWEHPEAGLLLPGRFIPLMEREHLIGQLDFYVLDKVCAFLHQLRLSGKEDFFVSCNFSTETFATKEFVLKCSEIINEYAFPRELLIFEISGTSAVHHTEMLKENAAALKRLGVSIVLDDPGEGFQTFLVSQEYALDGLKLDREMVGCIGTAAGDSSLRAMIRVCHEIGLTAVAEGVETEEQRQFLKENDCDVAQGFGLYHPMPEWEVRRMIGKKKDSGEVEG